MLTDSQYAGLRADMESRPELANALVTGDDVFVANFYNVLASPDYIVWRTDVSQDEIMQNGFDWVQVDNLSVGAARIWEWLFDNESNTINASKANVRAGIDECWKGTAAKLAVRNAVYLHLKRKANLIEKLFATGTGSDASPAVMGFEGELNYTDASKARVWGD